MPANEAMLRPFPADYGAFFSPVAPPFSFRVTPFYLAVMFPFGDKLLKIAGDHKDGPQSPVSGFPGIRPGWRAGKSSSGEGGGLTSQSPKGLWWGVGKLTPTCSDDWLWTRYNRLSKGSGPTGWVGWTPFGLALPGFCGQAFPQTSKHLNNLVEANPWWWVV